MCKEQTKVRTKALACRKPREEDARPVCFFPYSYQCHLPRKHALNKLSFLEVYMRYLCISSRARMRIPVNCRPPHFLPESTLAQRLRLRRCRYCLARRRVCLSDRCARTRVTINYNHRLLGRGANFNVAFREHFLQYCEKLVSVYHFITVCVRNFGELLRRQLCDIDVSIWM